MATDLQLATMDTTDGRLAAAGFGIYLNGAQVMVGDSFVGYEYVNDSRIAQYPMQAGSFASYNKVDTPFDVRVRITKGGSAADRANLLAEVEAARKSLNLYDVVTPENTYTSVNLVRVAHRHARDAGATMLTLELYFLEVRQTVSAVFSIAAAGTTPSTPVTKAAPGSRNDPTQLGVIRPQTPSPAVTAFVNQALQFQTNADHAAMTHH